MDNPSVTVTGAGSEWDNAQPLPAPSIDEMRYAIQVAPELSIYDTIKQMVTSPANELPTYEDAMKVLKGFGQAGESLGRGFVAGVPGMVGDVNEIGREYLIPNMPESVQSTLQSIPSAPTTEDYLKQIPRYSQPFGDSTANNFMEGLGTSLSPDALTALAPAGRFLGSAAADRIMAGKALIPGTNTEYLNPQILSAVKNKGGNWAQNSVNRLDALKYPIQNVGNSKFDFIRDNTNPAKVAEHISELQKVGYSPEQIREVQNEMAINKWVDSKIKPYIRNEMGTPTDPVLALHEQGISHIPDIGTEHFDPIYWIKEQRQKAGMPESGFAKSPQAKDWENRADQSIKNTPAQFIAPGSNNYSEDLGVLAGKNPDATVHELSTNARRLGFEHLTDELKNAIAHNSDLPAHLRLKPETLDKMTVPHAVKHVAKINKYRAEQMANAAKEGLKDFPVVHEGDKGFKIHELKLPTHLRELDEGHQLVPFTNEYGKPVHNIIDKNTGKQLVDTTKEAYHAIEQYSHKKNYEQLDKALKNEGEQMGHCVGCYTDSVASGESRIFSLRDDKGGAHATVEAKYSPANVEGAWGVQHPIESINDYLAWVDELNVAEKRKKGLTSKAGDILYDIKGFKNQLDYVLNNPDKFKPEFLKTVKEIHDKNQKINITQIKGKGNLAVSEKYRGYIKDWLNKEADKINDVEDLRNVGLVDTKSTSSVVEELKDMYGNDGMHLWNTAVEANPNAGARFMSREDIRKLVEPKKPEGHKDGGRIKMAEGGEPPKLTPFEQFKIDNAERIRQGQEDIANRNKYNPYKGSDRPVPTSKGMSGGAGFTPGVINPFNPDSPLNRKNGGKIPSIDEMRLTILRNK